MFRYKVTPLASQCYHSNPTPPPHCSPSISLIVFPSFPNPLLTFPIHSYFNIYALCLTSGRGAPAPSVFCCCPLVLCWLVEASVEPCCCVVLLVEGCCYKIRIFKNFIMSFTEFESPHPFPCCSFSFLSLEGRSPWALP